MPLFAPLARIMLGVVAVAAGLASAFSAIALLGFAAEKALTLAGLNPGVLRLLSAELVAADEAAYPILYYVNIGAGALAIILMHSLLLALLCLLFYSVGSSILDRKPAADPICETALPTKNHADPTEATDPGGPNTV